MRRAALGRRADTISSSSTPARSRPKRSGRRARRSAASSASGPAPRSSSPAAPPRSTPRNSPPCRKFAGSSAMRKNRSGELAGAASAGVDVASIMAAQGRASMLERGLEDHTRAFSPCRPAAIIAAPSASFLSGAARRARCRPTKFFARPAVCVASGFREIVLTGVDLTSYGARFSGGPARRSRQAILGAAPELERLRLSSIDCIEADADLIEAFAGEPRLMPHLHLSLQSGDDLILKRMKRRHRRADALALCAGLRRLRPEIVFGADLIAGFPTETEAMFRKYARARRGLRPDASSCLSVFGAARNSAPRKCRPSRRRS